MCKYSDDWSAIAWPYYGYGSNNPNNYKVNSLYDVFCNECNKYVNLLSGDEIDPDGRVPVRGVY